MRTQLAKKGNFTPFHPISFSAIMFQVESTDLRHRTWKQEQHTCHVKIKQGQWYKFKEKMPYFSAQRYAHSIINVTGKKDKKEENTSSQQNIIILIPRFYFSRKKVSVLKKPIRHIVMLM